MSDPRRCTVCEAPLPPVTPRGHPSPRCSDACWAAARRHRLDLAAWERAVIRWELAADEYPHDPLLRSQAVWCRERAATVRDLPDRFYLDPRASWALRSGDA